MRNGPQHLLGQLAPCETPAETSATGISVNKVGPAGLIYPVSYLGILIKLIDSVKLKLIATLTKLNFAIYKRLKVVID